MGGELVGKKKKITVNARQKLRGKQRKGTWEGEEGNVPMSWKLR